jgi:thiol-disulfide isomerase/thioredoxin
MKLPILEDVPAKEDFGKLLVENPGLLILKFGATWCGPCKKIEPLVHEWLEKLPDNVQFCMIDIDDCFDLYAFLQKKKMINGVPGILCYYRQNLTHIPNDSVVGADAGQINAFFERCLKKASGAIELNV